MRIQMRSFSFHLLHLHKRLLDEWVPLFVILSLWLGDFGFGLWAGTYRDGKVGEYECRVTLAYFGRHRTLYRRKISGPAIYTAADRWWFLKQHGVTTPDWRLGESL